MNKTVNINLAGIFFHIDENAYLKLQHYLDAIKQSFTDTEGKSEIISDIEMRIAELFNSYLKDDKHVIRMAEVDEVIAIMGQPEDYIVEDAVFEEDSTYEYNPPNTTTVKKLFRDPDNSYVGGVASGLGHYFGVDAIWIRLAWLLLVSVAGSGVIVYILLWILVPEAKTTAEKIIMTGDPVTISNIEKKVKDGFNTVSHTVNDVAKNVKQATSSVDVDKHKNRIKSSSKCIGGILVIIGITVIVSLIISLPTLNIVNTIKQSGLPFFDFFDASSIPIWTVLLIIFFLVSIPFFFLFYLGLKLLITNLKSIGNIAKFSLLGVWLLAIVGVAIISFIKITDSAFQQSHFEPTVALPIKVKDTLYVRMATSSIFPAEHHKSGSPYKLGYDNSNTQVLYSKDVGIVVKSTTDSVARISIKKNARGRSDATAIERAKNIDFNYQFTGNTLVLDPFSKTNPKFKKSDQEVKVILYLPEHSMTYFSGNTQYHLYRRTHYGNIVNSSKTNHYSEVLDGATKCFDCPVNTKGKKKWQKKKSKKMTKDVNVKINDEGIEINTKTNHKAL